jgi:hypothetical protein
MRSLQRITRRKSKNNSLEEERKKRRQGSEKQILRLGAFEVMSSGTDNPGDYSEAKSFPGVDALQAATVKVLQLLHTGNYRSRKTKDTSQHGIGQFGHSLVTAGKCDSFTPERARVKSELLYIQRTSG